MKLSKKQEEVVESKYSTTIVMSSAASGKTAVLTERARRILNSEIDPKKLVLITFTNNAAEEMRKRLGDIAKEAYIGTIHGFANYILLYNGESTYQYIQAGKFDELFEAVKKVEYIPEFEHLLLDEAQDTDDVQWEFILKLIKPKNLFVVGDIKQEIYSFNGKETKMFKKLYLLKDSKVFHLNENYRNGMSILQYASNLMSSKLSYEYHDNSICCSGRYGQVYKMTLNYEKIADIIKTTDEFRDWFILTRSNDQLNEMKSNLEKRGIPCATFRQADLNNSELSEVMESNTVKVLTIHSAKGLEAKNVMVYGALYYNKSEVCTTYVAMTRAKDRLYMLTAPKHREIPKSKTNVVNWE